MGIRGETVTDVSQRLLAHHGGLRGLLRLDVSELAQVGSLGDVKAMRRSYRADHDTIPHSSHSSWRSAWLLDAHQCVTSARRIMTCHPRSAV